MLIGICFEMKKEDIRLKIKAQKALLDDSERKDAASRAFSLLERTAAFVMADNVLMYHSLPDELSTHEFISKWCGRKNFFLPRVNGVNLEILPYDRSTLRLGAFRLDEPEGDNTVGMDNIDVVIVPSVAYDRKGNRVGRGKGYYDRLLADTTATRIGMIYDFQLIDEIETEPHDVGVDIVITDSRVLFTKRRP